MLTLHVWDLTLILEAEGMVVELSNKASKPVTTVRDCIPTFVSGRPLDTSSCVRGEKKKQSSFKSRPLVPPPPSTYQDHKHSVVTTQNWKLSLRNVKLRHKYLFWLNQISEVCRKVHFQHVFWRHGCFRITLNTVQIQPCMCVFTHTKPTWVPSVWITLNLTCASSSDTKYHAVSVLSSFIMRTLWSLLLCKHISVRLTEHQTHVHWQSIALTLQRCTCCISINKITYGNVVA